MARPRKNINPDTVLELARIGCTKTEAAAQLGCSVDTLDRRFAGLWRLGDAQGKTQLRRRQHERALEGSDTMLIHLGEHRLDQRDKPKSDVAALFDEIIADSGPEAPPADGSVSG